MLQHKSLPIAGTLLVAAGASVFAARGAAPPAAREFEEATITVHVNATDEDVAVMLAMEVAEEFLGLAVEDPFGNLVFHMEASDPSEVGLGLAEMIVESDHGDVADALAMYPEGSYRLTALSADGELFFGRARLSHELPVRPRIVSPLDGSVVQRDSLRIAWRTPADVDGFVLEIEGEGVDLTLELPDDVTSFQVPGGLLRRGETYQLGVAAVNDAGNSVVEEVHVSVAP